MEKWFFLVCYLVWRRKKKSNFTIHAHLLLDNLFSRHNKNTVKIIKYL